MALNQFGVYVHVPFCSKRCDYCAFATWTDRNHLQSAYLHAMRTQIERDQPLKSRPATSVFVGGGTPSLVPASELSSVLTAIPKHADAEVTVECNPDNVTADMFATYAAAGVNRVSFGVQSMVDRVLQGLGREHDRANVECAVELAKATGFRSFNLDLIYGGAGETVEDWVATLNAVLALDPPHISAYALTVEAGTPLAADTARHPVEEDQADRFDIVCATLAAAGYEHYEISNWAKPGHQCAHNVLYWTQGDYLGVGCAAHSHALRADGSSRRWWNLRTPERYLDAVRADESVEGAGEDLDAETVALERLQLALRMRGAIGGVPSSSFTDQDAAEFAEMGLLEHVPGSDRVQLTDAGCLLANAVSLRLRLA